MLRNDASSRTKVDVYSGVSSFLKSKQVAKNSFMS